MFERLPLPGVAAPMFSVDHWLEVPPLHHINDTATKGLGAVMPSYDDAVQGASQVCKIIRSRAHQPKLLERCFAGPINMQYHRRLKQFRGSIHTGRWATVAFAVPELLGIATIFRWGWNKQKFASGDVNARDQGREDTQNLVNGVDAFACSAFKWAFLVVLEALCVFLRRVTQFADSCPCHWHLFRSGAVPPEFFKLMEKQWLQCPFRGMMTAELSHTDFFDMLQGLVSTSTADLISQLPGDITAAERLKLINEFESGRAHLTFMYIMKLTHFSVPPFCVFKLGCLDEAVARAALQQCLDSGSDHPRIKRLRSPELFDLCLRWLAGESLVDVELGPLCAFVGEVRLALSSDRVGEAPHAKTKKAGRSAPCTTEHFMSFTARLPEIESLIIAVQIPCAIWHFA
jgi:hypothetical protein